MEGLRPKQLAQKGMSYIEKAILDLLFEAGMNKEKVGPTEISRRLGIYLPEYSYKCAITNGFLSKLKDQDLVENVGHGDWRLSKMERENRRED